MTASFLDGKKGRSLDNIIAKLSKVRSSKKGDRILLISEKNNACLPLSSDESEDGEADLHQCGTCKEMFTNLSSYITHKIEKPCRGPNKQQNHSNENEMEVDEEVQEKMSPGCSKVLKMDNDSNQEAHKKKHERKGMARKLTLAESETALLDENQIQQNDNDNQVVVVVSGDSEAGRRYIHENEVRQHERRDEFASRRSKDVDETCPRNMPYLERIPNYAYESASLYSHAGMSGYPLPNPDRTFQNHELEKDSVYRERMVPKTCGGERDVRETWPLPNKPTGFYRGPNEVPGHYPSYPPTNLYNPQYSLSHPSSYHRYSSTMHTTQAGKSCCSPAYATHLQYPADLYTIPIEEYNKGLYNKERREPPFKPASEPDAETAQKDKSQKSPKEAQEGTSDQADQIKTRSIDTNEQESGTADPSTAEPNEEENTGSKDRDVNAEAIADSKSPAAESDQQTNETDRPPTLVKVLSPTAKENVDSPFSSQRLDSNETNSVGGRSRGSSMSPTESALSSSNQSVDHVVSPSQVYERTSFVSQDDDASKQSMEPESPFQSNSIADDDVTSPKSKHATSDAALRGSENIIPQDSRPSFIHDKRSNASDVPYERRGEMFKPDGSPPNDASWRHSKQVYRCPLCAKIFPFKSKLQRHVLVHTGIKPYKCNVCGRGFTQQIDLQRHLTRHTGEKPFKCHLCKAQFIRADNLRKHAKDTHFVNIEEPIRKRRRKTTGSDTVLPPLEVAIAMAINETEKNGGRVLGRAGTRGNRANSRRERMPSADDEPRRMEAANETFARPTMGAVSSHQFPVGPPSMGFPQHGGAMPPFPRISSEMYEPMMHERSSPPPRLPNPQRYHPGSMVFQPRPDRFIERPYFARPPGDMPPMYWTSTPRHMMLSPNEVGPISSRDRFNSETSEGASSVFESREEGSKPELTNGVLGTERRSNSMSIARQGRLESEPERYAPPDDERVSHNTLPPPHSEMFRRSPAGRIGYPSEHRSPHMSDERPVHILDERGRFAMDRMRSEEERLHADPSPKVPALPSDNRARRDTEERFPPDDQMNRSPRRSHLSSGNEAASYRINHFNENDQRQAPPQEDEKAVLGYAHTLDSKHQNQNSENWTRYETGKLKTDSPVSDGVLKQNKESPEEKTNGYKGSIEEFASVSSQ